MMERPLILITNDDGVNAKGIRVLAHLAEKFGDVVVVAPAANSSGKGHSMTMGTPLRLHELQKEEHLTVYSCEGTPVDCVKLAVDYCCPRRPDLVLSGVNHGSNASVNVLYSGTMGAVVEASVSGYPAIGFSLLNHRPDADFGKAIPYMEEIVDKVLREGLPEHVSLNVNIPDGDIRGVRVCRQSFAVWGDSFEQRMDPYGHPYYWITGHFDCPDDGPDTDQWALGQGYVSIVPTQADLTAHQAIPQIKASFEK